MRDCKVKLRTGVDVEMMYVDKLRIVGYPPGDEPNGKKGGGLERVGGKARQKNKPKIKKEMKKEMKKEIKKEVEQNTKQETQQETQQDTKQDIKQESE